MKKTLFVLLFLISAPSFAQNMADKESYADAYRELPDGSSQYVGKCKTHEDYQGKLFKTTSVIQKYVEPYEFPAAKVKKIADKVGLPAIRFMMKDFFDQNPASESELYKKFAEYVDDITIDTIMVKDRPELDLIRFNVGYGGGNGGYLVLLRTSSGLKKMSATNDHDLSYCDLMVWKKK